MKITKQAKAARHAGIRALQAAGLFRPFVGYTDGGVGRRAHLIGRLVRQEAQRLAYDPAHDFVETE